MLAFKQDQALQGAAAGLTIALNKEKSRSADFHMNYFAAAVNDDDERPAFD